MLSEWVLRHLQRMMGTTLYVVLAYALFTIVPLILIGLFFWLFLNGRWGPSRDGLAVGIAVAVWASTCWLVVPYCGGYANLPGLFLVMAFGPPVDTWWKELLVHATNFILWPLVGWLFFRTALKGVESGSAVH